MNENMKNFYNQKEAELNECTKYIIDNYDLKSKDQLNLAVRIFRTRYETSSKKYEKLHHLDPIRLTGDRVSNKCLEILFGYEITTHTRFVTDLEAYDRLVNHLRIIETFIINKDSAVLIDDSCVGYIDNIDKQPHFWALTYEYNGGGYVDFNYNPPQEKLEKSMKFWKENGFL